MSPRALLRAVFFFFTEKQHCWAWQRSKGEGGGGGGCTGLTANFSRFLARSFVEGEKRNTYRGENWIIYEAPRSEKWNLASAYEGICGGRKRIQISIYRYMVAPVAPLHFTSALAFVHGGLYRVCSHHGKAVKWRHCQRHFIMRDSWIDIFLSVQEKKRYTRIHRYLKRKTASIILR